MPVVFSSLFGLALFARPLFFEIRSEILFDLQSLVVMLVVVIHIRFIAIVFQLFSMA